MITCKVEVKLEGLAKLERELRSGETPPEIQTALKQWSARMRAFLKARFIRVSRGGGTWPPLAESTVKRRRQGSSRSGRTIAMILRDTGTLLGALGPSTSEPGAYEQIGPGMTVTVGYGGPAKHPSDNKTRISDIAGFHQEGNSRLPKREIIVPPDPPTIQKMQEDMQRALTKRAKRLINE